MICVCGSHALLCIYKMYIRTCILKHVSYTYMLDTCICSYVCMYVYVEPISYIINPEYHPLR